jgi:hypothetical protein
MTIFALRLARASAGAGNAVVEETRARAERRAVKSCIAGVCMRANKNVITN